MNSFGRNKKNLAELTLSEQVYFGKKKSLDLLNVRNYSRCELKDKICGYGICEEAIDEIFAYLDKFHYLDDVRMAEAIIRAKRSSKSKLEIKKILSQKKISDEDMNLAFESSYLVDLDESPEEVGVDSFIKKHGLTPEMIDEMTYEEKQKFAAKLFRKGFSEKIIKDKLNF